VRLQDVAGPAVEYRQDGIDSPPVRFHLDPNELSEYVDFDKEDHDG
jgi:hypothetical protein